MYNFFEDLFHKLEYLHIVSCASVFPCMRVLFPNRVFGLYPWVRGFRNQPEFPAYFRVFLGLAVSGLDHV